MIEMVLGASSAFAHIPSTDSAIEGRLKDGHWRSNRTAERPGASAQRAACRHAHGGRRERVQPALATSNARCREGRRGVLE